MLSKIIRTASRSSTRFLFASSLLRKRLEKIVPQKRQELIEIRQKHGNKKVSEVTVNQIIGGMRGVKALFYDTSKLDAYTGINFRGRSIVELEKKLPTAGKGLKEALPEGVLWLLYGDSYPTLKEFRDLQQDLRNRSHIGKSTLKFIKRLPLNMHPLTQLSSVMLYLQRDSKFTKAYHGGVSKLDLWKYAFEDSLDLIAKIAPIGAYIYRHTFYKDDFIKPDPTLDYGGNFSHMMGFDDEAFMETVRGYLAIHTDHEGGNVSAHATHLVGSALSDPYLSMSAGLNGLAGPLHGLAAQEALKWLLKLQKKLGDNPTGKQIQKFCNDQLDRGQVIPGFGHAVLRATDPRYTHLQGIARRYIKKQPLIRLARKCLTHVPPVLTALGKVANPWPNVDAHSGVLLHQLGMKEFDYYTVIFAVSRSIGCMSAFVWSRIMGLPIERPGSVDVQFFKKFFEE